MTKPQTVGRGPYRESDATPPKRPPRNWRPLLRRARRIAIASCVASAVTLLGALGVKGCNEVMADERREVEQREREYAIAAVTRRHNQIAALPRFHAAAQRWCDHAYPQRAARVRCVLPDLDTGRSWCTATVDAVPPIRLRCTVAWCAVEWPETRR